MFTNCNYVYSGQSQYLLKSKTNKSMTIYSLKKQAVMDIFYKTLKTIYVMCYSIKNSKLLTYLVSIGTRCIKLHYNFIAFAISSVLLHNILKSFDLW